MNTQFFDCSAKIDSPNKLRKTQADEVGILTIGT